MRRGEGERNMVGAIGYGGASALWPRISYASAVQPAQAAFAASSVAAPQDASTRAGDDGGFVPASELPYVPEGYGPEELAARTRVMFPNLGTPLSNALEGKLAGLESEKEQQDIPGVEDAKSPAEVMDDAKCETCEKRKYQDGSDDPGVSFKNAQHVDPSVAGAAVRGHEQEHVVRERAKAEREDRKVISQTVTYHTGICPECGRFYVSGGTTRTVTAADNSKALAKEQRKKAAGEDFDISA